MTFLSIINTRNNVASRKKNGGGKNEFVCNSRVKRENIPISHAQQRVRRHTTQMTSNEGLFHSTFNNNWTVGM
jgi:hypothetical protein